jgi:hypothetical protein
VGKIVKKRKGIADFKRHPETVLMPLSQIKVDKDRPLDPAFVEIYGKYLSGKITGAFTRVDIDLIIPGFFRRQESGEYSHLGDSESQEITQRFMFDVKCGFRPSLCVYKAHIGPAKGKFICSDDVVSYNAYKQLGIRRVPVTVLGNHPELLNESAIITRGNPDSKAISFVSLFAHKVSAAQSCLGDDNTLKKLKAVDALSALDDFLQSTEVQIKAFHISGRKGDEIYYHHTLYSIIYRLREILSAVSLLLSNGLAYQIRRLIRSAYDLFLNFYVDWLSPEKVGLVLQGLSALSESGSDADKVRLERIMKAKFGSLIEIFGNQFEKGRISPLGPDFHRRIYSALSPSVHQDFGVTLDYGNALESGKPYEMTQEELMANLRWLDLVVCATASRVLDDVGVGGIGEFE